MTKRKPSPTRRRKRRSQLSRRKRIVFTLIALALPMLALVLVEIGLRLFTTYGGYPPTIKKIVDLSDTEQYLTTNPEGSQAFFFRNKDLPGTLAGTGFRSPKPDNTFRVFLFGGSAIKGYPQTRAFAPSAFLKEILADAWPERDVEVINFGTTAVASFPALVMLTDALEHEPDLVVVYSGHNEFFGAFGVASLNTVARSPTMIALQYTLRRFALVQWIDALLAPTPKSGKGSSKMLMEIMMAQPYTGPDDPVRQAAARNLGAHITQMIKRCKSANVPVLVCTLPVNERGLAPLGTFPLEELNPADQRIISKALDEAPKLIKTDPSLAADSLRTIINAAPDHARAHWLLASSLQASGQTDVAAAHFTRSVDLDPMPWRATSIQNDAIRDAAADNDAILCDVQAAFRDASEGGSIGWDLMDDHVHMSLRGQELVARTIARALTTIQGPARIDPEKFATLPDFQHYAHRLGDNPFERYAVAYRMRKLMDVPFFRDSNPGALLHTDTRLRNLEAEMTPSELNAARSWHDPSVNMGYQRPLSSIVGAVANQEGRFEEAAQCFRTTMKTVPQLSEQSVRFAYLYCRALQRDSGGSLPEEALHIARDAYDRTLIMIQHSPEPEPKLHRHAGTLLKVLGDHEGSIPHLFAARLGFGDAGLVELDGTLVHSLIEARQFDRALSLVDWGIANSGHFAPAYQALRAGIIDAQNRARADPATESLGLPPDPDT